MTYILIVIESLVLDYNKFKNIYWHWFLFFFYFVGFIFFDFVRKNK